MLSWIFSRLIGRLLRSGASRRHLGRPGSRKRTRTDHFFPCEPDPTPPIRIHHCNPFQPFVSVPIFTWPYSTARSNPLISRAIVIPDSFRAYHYRAMSISVWPKRTSLSSISCLSFSASTCTLRDVSILTVHQDRGAVAIEDLMRSIHASRSNAANRKRLFQVQLVSACGPSSLWSRYRDVLNDGVRSRHACHPTYERS